MKLQVCRPMFVFSQFGQCPISCSWSGKFHLYPISCSGWGKFYQWLVHRSRSSKFQWNRLVQIKNLKYINRTVLRLYYFLNSLLFLTLYYIYCPFPGDDNAALVSCISLLVKALHDGKMSLEDALKSSSSAGVLQCKYIGLPNCGCSIKEWYKF